MKIKYLILSFVTLISLSFLPAAKADHPAYIHALSDLRYARYLISASEYHRDRVDYVVSEIDRAIWEIKHAAIDDGKDINDHDPVDGGIDDHGRWHRALEALHRAHHDVSEDEDNGFAQGLQHRALEHIDRAEHAVRGAIGDWGW